MIKYLMVASALALTTAGMVQAEDLRSPGSPPSTWEVTQPGSIKQPTGAQVVDYRCNRDRESGKTTCADVRSTQDPRKFFRTGDLDGHGSLN